MLSLKLLPGVRELLPGVAAAFSGDFLPAGVLGPGVCVLGPGVCDFGPGVLTGVQSPGRTFLISLTT